jgi:hypothetical protein
VLTDEAKGYAARGSPEVQLVAAIPPEGASKGALKVVSLSIHSSCSIGVKSLGLLVQLDSSVWVLGMLMLGVVHCRRNWGTSSTLE